MTPAEEHVLKPEDVASWAAFFSTVRVGGALPVTFRGDGSYVIIEVVVPYVQPVPREPAEPNKIPLRIADGFPVPLTGRHKLPPFSGANPEAFVRQLVREIYLHEVDEQLHIGDRRPFAPDHSIAQ